jgi:Tol biopolymer transport system component
MITSRVLVGIVALSLLAQACAKEPVRSELARLQKQTGLNLVSVHDSEIYTVDFAKRSKEQALPFLGGGGATQGAISPMGTEIAFDYGHLGTIRIDGSGLRQYLGDVYPRTICWSNDKTKLAFEGRQCCGQSLWILDLNSGTVEEAVVAPPKLVEPFLTPQCWSQDGKQFVYWLNTDGGEVRIYDTASGKSHKLAVGISPTWSPDGKWIAFLSDGWFYNDSYFVVHPSGSDKRKLVRTTEGYGGLHWSPDSRFVAYWSTMSLSEIIHYFGVKGLLYFSVFRLRVTRLNDGSEDWVLEKEPMWDYQWVTNTALNSH